MADLSLNARIVAGSMFGFSPRASIRYRMVESVPSPEMQGALDELVAAGIVVREDEPHGAVMYMASADFDFTDFRQEIARRVFDGTSPAIRVFMPRTTPTGSGSEKP